MGRESKLKRPEGKKKGTRNHQWKPRKKFFRGGRGSQEAGSGPPTTFLRKKKETIEGKRARGLRSNEKRRRSITNDPGS